MTQRGAWHAAAATAALAVAASAPSHAQQWTQLRFGNDVFDVTGAGTLELGDLDAVLAPFGERFAVRRDRVQLALEVDRAGEVIGCSASSPEPLAEAGTALCAHARAAGKFRMDPWLVLDFSKATYQLTVEKRPAAASGQPPFTISDAYPFERHTITFADYAVPPEDQRLSQADLIFLPMEYPRLALRTEIQARVVAVLHFDETGALATCRPVQSTNTARIAYETCAQARTNIRLQDAPDARPYVLSVNWSISGE